jgi:hypothetical protein
MKNNLRLIGNLPLSKDFSAKALDKRSDERIIRHIEQDSIGHVFIDGRYHSLIDCQELNDMIRKMFPDLNYIEKESAAVLYFKNVDKHVDAYPNKSWLQGKKPYILNYLLGGEGLIRIHYKNSKKGDRIRKKIPVKTGDLFIVDPTIYHSFKSTCNETVVSYNLFVNLRS